MRTPNTPTKTPKTSLKSLAKLSPDQLLGSLKQLVAHNNQLTTKLLAYLGEVDARRLYLDAAFPSMFAYCVEVLNLSEGATSKRIAAARAARKNPAILEYIRSGRLHLTAVQLLTKYLTPDNSNELLEAAAGLSKRQVEKLLAAQFPAQDVPSRVRKLPRRQPPPAPNSSPAMPLLEQPRIEAKIPAAKDSPTTPPPAPRTPQAPPPRTPDVMTPLSERRYKVQFTADQALADKLREAQNLLGHQVENNDLAEVFDRALELLVKDLRKKKFAETDRPRTPAPPAAPAGGTPTTDTTSQEDSIARRPSRHIPSAVKRAVARRDDYQCTYVDPTSGRRCSCRSALEYHHEIPWAEGGPHHEANLSLRCKAHNLHAARRDFGQDLIERKISEAHEDEAIYIPRGMLSGGQRPTAEVAPPAPASPPHPRKHSHHPLEIPLKFGYTTGVSSAAGPTAWRDDREAEGARLLSE